MNKNNTSSNLSLFSKAKDLKNKVLFTLFILVIYRLGSYVPIPSIDFDALNSISQQSSGSIIGVFNMLSGGALGRMSIFALGIMPYITASIIIQLLSSVFKSFEHLKKEGESGKKKLNQYTRLATVFLSIIQAYGIVFGIENMNFLGKSVVINPSMEFRLIAITSLVCGTMLIMWLGERISQKGIGNGTSLIIFTGIVAGLPRSLASVFELNRSGALSSLFVIILLLLAIALVFIIVFMERANRRIHINYPKRQQIGSYSSRNDSSYLPLKLNTAGVIPPIFASSILLFPMTIAQFSANNEGKVAYILEKISLYLSHGKPLYLICYVALIMFFSFFYTSIIFNPNDTADNLKKHGGFISGIRPGQSTSNFLDNILTKLTVIGSLYMALICVLPEILIAKYSSPLYLGGTSILIVVNVILDTITQIQSYLFSYQYESLIKKARIKR